MVRLRRTNIEGHHRVTLALLGLQVLKAGEFVNESLHETREGIRTFLGGRHHENLKLRVTEQQPAHEG